MPATDRRRQLIQLIRRHWLIGLLLAGGVLLRVLAQLAYNPALLFNGDSYFYLLNAADLRPDSFHPAGYAVVLKLLSWTGHLASVTIVQHCLGVLAAILLYRLLLQKIGRPWIAALGTAPLLVDSYLIVSESMILSESLTMFLYVASLMLIASKGTRLRNFILGGLLLAAASITRSTAVFGIILVMAYAVVCLYYLPVARRRLFAKQVIVLLLCFGLPVVAYCGYHARSGDGFAIDNKSAFFLYGRLSQIADCTQLSATDQKLCPNQPVAQRQNTSWFLWTPQSPLRTSLTGESYNVPLPPLRRYDDAVLKNQYPTFIASVAVETARYFKPFRTAGIKDDQVTDSMFPTKTPWTDTTFLAADSFQSAGDPKTVPKQLPRPDLSRFLAAYQRFGYLPGPLLLVAVLVTLVSILRRRTDLSITALLFVSFGLLQLLITSTGASLNYRYLVPVEGLIWAGGVLATYSLYTSLYTKSGERRSK